jgi:DNA-binding protein Fis
LAGERAVVLAPGDELTCDLLPEAVVNPRQPKRRLAAFDPEVLAQELVQQAISAAGSAGEDLYNKIVNRVERELFAQVLAACDNVRIKAAARLGINRNTLQKKLKEYGLDEGPERLQATGS